VRVLIAPDKFRGTLTARQAAEAVATGWRRERPDDELDLAPMADGGEGTLDGLVGEDGRRVACDVHGPLGDPVRAEVGFTRAGVAVVEMARAAGLALLDERRRDPTRASTRGVGEMILHALDARASGILVCLGGSATNDGGTGMARALGVRFLDAAGHEVAEGGAALAELVRIDARALDRRLASTEVTGLVDVDNPLTGPHGASATYGPQKGASASDVRLLDLALGHLAAVVDRDLGARLGDEPGAGAAGGLGFGLRAFCGAHLRSGAPTVMEAVGLADRGRDADLIVTGEGALDATSLRGKVVGSLLELGQLAGVPVAVVCGRADVAAPGAVVVRSLVDEVGEATALGETRRALEALAQSMAADASRLVGSAS
jgi:glycerate kinase